ncbi:hypothetical protein Vadar_002413 [Vaccinium darrowii]|uniref:Uncharacterized protein n=1 Tax=Vaccinium darrowii TaxID=229202 RepID=A0ACB7XEW6_9ERIC|nr:hypothetical protein Vadar_002413 [Vaccinium darrowii]
MHAINQISEVAAEELESWCWVHVSPMVDLAIKWTALRSNPCIYNFFDWQKGNKGGSMVLHLTLNSLSWIVSAVLYMLSGVLDRVIPEDAIRLPAGCLPWLPEFVPKIGLEIIKNGFLRSSGTKDTEYGGSFVEYLRDLRLQDLLTVEDMNFSMQRINSSFGACLILGPREGSVLEKALDTLLQVPVLKYLDLSIRHFITLNKDLKPFVWDYKEKEYQLFSKVLASHFRNRWLTVKKKLKAPDGNSGLGKKMSKKGGILDTIHEDLDISNMTGQEDYCPSLAIEWANQRLPLPMHWFLSPISTINGIKHTDPSVPSKNNKVENHSDFLEIAKAGLFFLLGIEVMSSFFASEIECSFRRVPLTWKLHSLSLTLLRGMGVLEEETSRNMFETLQEIYGKLLEESWLSKSKEVIPEGKEKLSAQTGQKDSVKFLCFQSEIHESYSTFMETLVEQFAAASYGDLIYG